MKKSLFFFFLPGVVFLILLIFTMHTKNPYQQKQFVTVELQGQLGNQLFQIAAAFAYARDHNCEFLLPKKYLKANKLGIKQNCKKIFHRFNYKTLPFRPEKLYYEPPPFNFSPIPFVGTVKLQGFFESEKYFSRYKKEIKQLLAPSFSMKNFLKTKHFSLLSHPKCIGIHIRTFYKDFLGAGVDLFSHFPPPDLDYIKKAMDLFDPDSLFIVCSDYIPWCKKHLSNLNKNIVFIEGQKRHEDFYLLTLCKHMITSNSTFSWWAAYLNTNPNKKIIVRTPWSFQSDRKTEDIIPKNWIQIKGSKDLSPPEFDNL